MAETPTFGRYAEIPYEQMTPEQQEGYRSLIETRGRLPGPNKIYVHNPKLAKVMGPLGAHFRTGYSLSEREREIAVCVVTSKYHSDYPVSGHERAAKAAGLRADQVEAILSGLPTSFSDTREQIVYEMAMCLTNVRWVPKGLYDRAVSWGNKPPWELPARYLERKPQADMDTALNFVSTADIIGGNSGSPTINRTGEFVGIIFDGNIESLAWDHYFDEEKGRSVSVDAQGILEALDEIYDAEALVKELVDALAGASAR